MKGLIIIFTLFLAGCVHTPNNTIVYDHPIHYHAPVYAPLSTYGQEDTIFNPVMGAPPVQNKPLIYRSFAELGNTVVHDMLNTPELKRYLKHNKKAWITIRYDRYEKSPDRGLKKEVYQKNAPSESNSGLHDYNRDGVNEDGVDADNGPTYSIVGFRGLIEYSLINAGFKRVVVGSYSTRLLLSDERKYQLNHAKTKTIHPPGHVEGSSLIVILDVYQKLHPPRFFTYDKEKGIGIGVPTHEFDDAYPVTLKVSVVRVTDDQIFFSNTYSVRTAFNQGTLESE
jgi:hypothetical protein